MMVDVKRFMFLLIDTVGLLVDRTRVVAGFNHTPTYQARERGVRQWRRNMLAAEQETDGFKSGKYVYFSCDYFEYLLRYV